MLSENADFRRGLDTGLHFSGPADYFIEELNKIKEAQ
jgi:hypothetical protein